MPTENIEFTGHSGDALAARLDMPDGPVHAFALFAHCFTCSKDIAAARRIAQHLPSVGIGVLRFDFTGLGGSGGDFADTTFSSNVDDLVIAADWLRQNRAAPQLLVGHSLGGAAVLAATPKIPEVKAVATIGAPADPEHVIHNFGGMICQIEDQGAAEVDLAGRTFTIKKDFLDDVAQAKLDDSIGKLRAALMVLHAPRDATVGIENAAAIFAAAKHPKSFVTLDDADHLLSRSEDGDYAAEVIAAWSRRYVEQAANTTPLGTKPGLVTSREADGDKFLQNIAVGPKHKFRADEPAAYGGTDLGPSPYDLVSAGLAACTSMTVRMYARRKGWALENVSVDVEHDKVHAKDCEDCEANDGRIDEFRRTVHLTGDLTDEQRAKLMEIADKCPVHRTMESEVKVRTSAG